MTSVNVTEKLSVYFDCYRIIM